MVARWEGLTSVITDAKGVSNIWRVPVDGSAPQQLTRFDDNVILAFSWSPGGRQACVCSSELGIRRCPFQAGKNRDNWHARLHFN